jgi:hypothetical protein
VLAHEVQSAESMSMSPHVGQMKGIMARAFR